MHSREEVSPENTIYCPGSSYPVIKHGIFSILHLQIGISNQGNQGFTTRETRGIYNPPFIVDFPKHTNLQLGIYNKQILVGGFNPPEKYDFVSWDDDIPNCFWKVINFHGSSHHQPDYGNFINPTVKPQCFFSDLWKQPYEVAKRSGMANNYEVGLQLVQSH